MDQSLDDAADHLARCGCDRAGDRGGHVRGAAWQERAQELEAVNEALRQRLAVERLRFGERSALLERAANTSVESAIKAVHGQDVIVRRRLEQTEKEMKRLQEETALQQAELRAIHASLTMRALAPPEPGTSASGGRRAERSRPVGHPQGRPESTLGGSSTAGWPASPHTPAAGPAVAVLAGGDEGTVPEQALVELLSGPLAIGAVVPLLYGPRARYSRPAASSARPVPSSPSVAIWGRVGVSWPSAATSPAPHRR